MLVYSFGTSRLTMTYTDKELSELVEGILEKESGAISFSQLCAKIIEVALKVGKLRVANHTQYAKIDVTQEDGERISRILWDLIWAKRLCIDFYLSQDSKGFNEFYFKKIE
jgi:hypothetical protein